VALSFFLPPPLRLLLLLLLALGGVRLVSRGVVAAAAAAAAAGDANDGVRGASLRCCEGMLALPISPRVDDPSRTTSSILFARSLCMSVSS
jgi:hypothetical protein